MGYYKFIYSLKFSILVLLLSGCTLSNDTILSTHSSSETGEAVEDSSFHTSDPISSTRDSESSSTVASPEPEAIASSSPLQAIYNIKEDAIADFFTYNIKSVSTATEIGPYESENQYVIVEISITNSDVIDHFYHINAFKLRDDKGREYQPYPITVGVESFDYLIGGTISPGLSLTGLVAFELPKEISGMSVLAASGKDYPDGSVNLTEGTIVEIKLGL